MHTEQLKKYVIDRLNDGYSQEALESALLDVGWSSDDIKTVFSDTDVRSLSDENESGNETQEVTQKREEKKGPSDGTGEPFQTPHQGVFDTEKKGVDDNTENDPTQHEKKKGPEKHDAPDQGISAPDSVKREKEGGANTPSQVKGDIHVPKPSRNDESAPRDSAASNDAEPPQGSVPPREGPKRSISNPASMFIENEADDPEAKNDRSDGGQKKAQQKTPPQNEGGERSHVAAPAPSPRSSQKKKHPKHSQSKDERNSRTPLILLGVAVLFMIGAGIYVGVWLMTGQGEEGSEVQSRDMEERNGQEQEGESDPEREREISQEGADQGDVLDNEVFDLDEYIEEIRAYAALYFFENDESFDGICQTSRSAEMLVVIEDELGVVPYCRGEGRSAMAEVELENGQWFCIDATGFVGMTSRPAQRGDLECQQ